MIRRSFLGASLLAAFGSFLRPQKSIATATFKGVGTINCSLSTPCRCYRLTKQIIPLKDGEIIILVTYKVRAKNFTDLSCKINFDVGQNTMAYVLTNPRRYQGILTLFYVKEDAHLTKDGWEAEIAIASVDRDRCDPAFVGSLVRDADWVYITPKGA